MTLSNSEGYREYMKSPKWRAVRKIALEQSGGVCCNCGSDERLEAHHLTYERLGFERPEDLIVLCSVCHAKEHNRPAQAGPVAWISRDEITQRVFEAYREKCLAAWRVLLPKIESIERIVNKLFEEAQADGICGPDIYDSLSASRLELAILAIRLREAIEGGPTNTTTSAARIFTPEDP